MTAADPDQIIQAAELVESPTGTVEKLIDEGGIGILSPLPLEEPEMPEMPEMPETPQDPLALETLFHLARTGDFQTLLMRLNTHENGWVVAIQARDQDQHTLLHWGSLFNATDFIKKFCSRANLTDINAKSANGQTAFMWACLKGHIESMRVLFHDFSADIWSTDSLRADGGILAVQHHQHNAMLLLWRWRKDTGSSRDCVDSMGCSAVHWAAYKGDIQALRILNYMGADMNGVDNSGMTPLHRATGEGWNDCALFLVSQCGSDANLKNFKNDESPIDIARRLENKGLLISLALAMDRQVADRRGAGNGWDNLGSDPDIQFKWALPAIFIVCISCVAISFLTDFTVSEIPRTNWASLCFIVCVAGSILLFSFLVTGDPGVVPKRVHGESALEDLAEAVDGGEQTRSANQSQDLSRICFTCWEWKGLRTKHCSVCDVCVDGFDHHCGWLNTCVAEKNHREFILMILFVFIGSLFYLGISLTVFFTSESSFWTVWYERPLLIPCWVINGVICPWLAMLVTHQLRTIALNLNTNEMMNMHRYAHFWDGPAIVTGMIPGNNHHHHENDDHHECDNSSHHHGGGRKFRNPFDQGSVWKNCKYFWLRQKNKKKHVYIELEEYV